MGGADEAIDVHALREVSLELLAGGSVAIMGASGSGKSTTLNILGMTRSSRRSRRARQRLVHYPAHGGCAGGKMSNRMLGWCRSR